MQCGQCGASVPDHAKFCARCGAVVGAGTDETIRSPAQAASGSAPTASASETAAELLAGARSAWALVGSAQLAAAAIFAGAATVFGLVGLMTTLSASPSSVGKVHGLIWLVLGSVLALAAVGWCAAARGPFAESTPWPRAWDARVMGIGAAIATVFSLIGIIASYGSPATSANGTAWLTFAQIVALTSFGWMMLTRPLTEGKATIVALACTAVAVLFGLIGLVAGLGSEGEDYFHGLGWLGSAVVWAIIGTAALLSGGLSARASEP